MTQTSGLIVNESTTSGSGHHQSSHSHPTGSSLSSYSPNQTYSISSGPSPSHLPTSVGCSGSGTITTSGSYTPVLSDMPSRRCRFGVACLGGLVYVVGGFNGNLRVRSVEVYDPARNVWHSGPNLEYRRSTLGVAVLNGLIYAVGGFDGSTGRV
ncbi:unnamed protein product [Protopolystoma xenopodis]|uniref:BACK domain-containing protein n=1 Tax=Protopolystoma xenopodis TaxID=117903 RepID=A0A448WPY7_9PLAT|nr:unnamed protein product [Protopolystoma xenopodis]